MSIKRRVREVSYTNNFNDLTLDETLNSVHPLLTVSHIINVKKNPGAGEYLTIIEAITSITDSAVNNRYLIYVGPGTYIEPLIDMTMKPYVSICSDAIQSAVVLPDSDNHHIFIIGVLNELSFLWLEGTGAGYAGIAALDSGDYSQAHKVTFNNCDIGVLVRSVTQYTAFYGEYLDFNGSYSYGVKIEATNNIPVFVNLENYYNLPTVAQPTIDFPYGTFITGANATCHIHAAGNIGIGEGTAVLIQDGAEIDASSITIESFDSGIYVPNIGAPTIQNFISSAVRNCTTIDILVEHPSASGAFQGVADNSKVTIDSELFNILIQDLNGSSTGSLNISKSLNIRFPNGTSADVSTLIIESGTMGVMEGGELSSTLTPFELSIDDGFGYLEQFPDQDFLKRIDWPISSIILDPNTSNYIFFNYNGILAADSMIPNTFFNILLGKVTTNSDDIEFIESIGIQAEHYGNRISDAWRNAIGSIFVSGSTVSENVIPFHIDISQGVYYFAENKFSPSGGTDVTFVSFYRDGSSGFIRTTTDTIDGVNYDDGSGTLQPLSSGYYTKHAIYVTGEGANEKYFLVYGQEEFSALALVEQGNIPLPPSSFDDSVTLIASIIVKQGVSSIIEIQDIRPVIGFRAPTVSATTFHGNLLGLNNDDHPQYLLANGTRSLTGNLDVGGNNITNVNLVDGVDVSAHTSRHLPNGADPLTTGAAISVGSSNTIGIANSLSRADHQHTIGSNIITDSMISSHTSTKITITTKGQLNSAIAYNDQANIFGDFNQIFRSSRLLLSNPANTFNYTFIGSAIVASRNITIPLLSSNDIMVTEAFSQTLTNKTVDGLLNTITNISLVTGVTGILLPSNGGTGVNNGSSTITLSGNLITIGSFNTTFAQQFSGIITLPSAASTLATLALAEALINKTSYNGLIITANTGVITTGVWNGTAITNAFLANSSITVNGTSISLGGSAAVTAAAGTLTGTTLNASVTLSSLTTLGTIVTGVWNGTAITAANGGTGQTTYAIGDLLYASAATTLSKLADVATGNALISGGVTAPPLWGKIGLTTHISGILPIANGGTNSSIALNNNRIIISSGSAIIEHTAQTAAKISFYDTNGLPTFNTNIEVDNVNTRVFIGGVTPTDILHLGASTTSHASLRIPAGTAPTSPNDGVIWNDSTQKTITSRISGANQNFETVLFTQTATGSVGNTTTETTIISTGVGTVTFPANFFTAGKTIRIIAIGTLSRASGNLTFRFKIGGTTFAANTAANPNNSTNGIFTLEIYMTCRTTGVSGTAFSQGIFRSIDGNSNFGLANTATNTINTTISNIMDLTYQQSATNAGNSIACTNLTIQILN